MLRAHSDHFRWFSLFAVCLVAFAPRVPNSSGAHAVAGGSVRGTVRDVVGPVPGVVVYLKRYSADAARTAVTAENGAFVFNDVADEYHQLSVFVSGFEPFHQEWLRPGPERSSIVDVRMNVLPGCGEPIMPVSPVPRTGVLVGRALDTGGHPLGAALVDVDGRQTLTDATGAFAYESASERYAVTVTASGYEPRTVVVSSRAGERRAVELRLPAIAALQTSNRQVPPDPKRDCAFGKAPLGNATPAPNEDGRR